MRELAELLKRPDWKPTPDVHAALLSEAHALSAMAEALRARAETASEAHAKAVARFHDRLDAYLVLHELYRRRMGMSGAAMPDPIAEGPS